MTHYVADVSKARELLGWAAADAARRGHPAVGRLVQGMARGASRRKTARSSGRASPARSSMASSSPPAPAPRRVLALFGPTASGKTAVAGLLREQLGAEVISADSAALYDGIPRADRGARLSGAARRRRSARARTSRSGATSSSRTRRSTRPRRRSSSAARGSTSARRSRSSRSRRGDGARTGRQEVDRLGPEAAHALLAERDPAAARACTRTTAAASCARSSSPRRATRSRRRTTGCGPTTRATRRRSSRSTCRCDELDRRIAVRTRAMAAAGRRRGGGARVGAAALRDGAEGARARGVRHAARSTKRSNA